MDIQRDSLVTRTDPYFAEKSCEDGACVGRVTEIGDTEHNPDVWVKWYETCNYHSYRTITDNSGRNSYHFLSSELTVIGQIPAN